MTHKWLLIIGVTLKCLGEEYFVKLQSYLKKRIEEMPCSWGKSLSHIPFVLRLGPAYHRYGNQIVAFETMTPTEAEDWVIRRLQRVVDIAQTNIPFYKNFYHSKGINIEKIDNLYDFRRLPIVTKEDFREVALDDRLFKRGMEINTGGTSGQPLTFHVEKNAFAREWAHMHYLWYSRGYRKEHLKLTFRGKHFSRNEPLKYNGVHNELIVNANSSLEEVVAQVIRWSGVPIRWIHGYPSLVAEFAKKLGDVRIIEREYFRSKLYGILLGSEFPAPHYRKLIEDELSTNVLCWYGHSEMAILAEEFARDQYRSLPTYGYSEAVEIEKSGRYRLVTTSYANNSHPFIRYDTGDIIEPISEGPYGLTFRIVEGRVGDFIYDRNHLPHSLTAIIFGRHHAAFSKIHHVQVGQKVPGEATLLITAPLSLGVESIRTGFDLSGLDIKWDIQILNEPIRTAAGKIKLKVGSNF